MNARKKFHIKIGIITFGVAPGLPALYYSALHKDEERLLGWKWRGDEWRKCRKEVKWKGENLYESVQVGQNTAIKNSSDECKI